MYVSCRKSFSAKVAAEFGLELYTDFVGYFTPIPSPYNPERHNRVVV